MTILATGKFALPFIAVAQAQKEITHNEALVLIDALLHCSIQSVTASVPVPDGEADAGKCWLVATGAGGAFEDMDDRIACWTGAGWRFVEPVRGMSIVDVSSGHRLEWHNQWQQPPQISGASGGTVIDIEGREALSQLLDYLRERGLLAV